MCDRRGQRLQFHSAHQTRLGETRAVVDVFVQADRFLGRVRVLPHLRVRGTCLPPASLLACAFRSCSHSLTRTHARTRANARPRVTHGRWLLGRNLLLVVFFASKYRGTYCRMLPPPLLLLVLLVLLMLLPHSDRFITFFFLFRLLKHFFCLCHVVDVVVFVFFSCCRSAGKRSCGTWCGASWLFSSWSARG